MRRISVPRRRILVPGPRLGLKGVVRNVQVLDHGRVVWESGPFENLVLDQGLNYVATKPIADLFRYCAVGTGNTPPAANQTSLVTEAARTGNLLTGEGNCGSTLTGNVLTMRRTFEFPLGSLNGNYAELGFSDASGAGSNLFSRVLIQQGGSPVAVSVSSSQQLRVVYELAVTFSNIVSPFNIDFGGAWGVVTGQMAIQSLAFDNNYSAIKYVSIGGSSVQSSILGRNALEPSEASSIHVSSSAAALAAVGSYNPRANLAGKTATLGAYAAGTFYRDKSVTFGTTEANGTVRSVILGSGSEGHQCFTALFDSDKIKQNTSTLSLTIRLTWGRN